MRKQDDSKGPRVLAACIADLHFTLEAPVSRAETPDKWMESQSGYMEQVAHLLRQYDNCPLLVAGDVFHDGWREKRCPAELINFVVRQFDRFNEVIMIPGQHDLPHHRYADINKSGYWTLVKSSPSIIKDLKPGYDYLTSTGLLVTGFPWGSKITEAWNGANHMAALCHRYVYDEQVNAYSGVDCKYKTDRLPKVLVEYNFAVFGDNHKPFTAKVGNCAVVNCGGFLRRNSDEIEYRPRVHFLMSDRTVRKVSLDTREDKWVSAEMPGKTKDTINLGELKDLMENESGFESDFVTLVEKHAKKRNEELTPEVRNIITKILAKRR